LVELPDPSDYEEISAPIGGLGDTLEILGLGTAVLDEYAPDFFGAVEIRGAQLILKADGRLTHSEWIDITNGGTLFLDNSEAAHADRLSDTAYINLYAGRIAFDPGDFGFLTQEVGAVYLNGGANQIDLHLGSAAGGQLLAGDFWNDTTATLNIRYSDPTGGSAPTNVHFALKDEWMIWDEGGILPWATITQSDGVQVDWVEWEAGVTTVFNPLANYQTDTPENWSADNNVLIDGSTAPLPGQASSLEINSLKLANGGILDLGNDNELVLLAGGLLSSGTSNVRITGDGTLTSSWSPLYIHVHSPSLSVEGGASISIGFNRLVKSGGGTLQFASPNATHTFSNLYINEGTVSLNSGTILLNAPDDYGGVFVGDGYGTDVLELPANRTNPIQSAIGLPFITLHGSPYGANPDSGEFDAAILRFGGGTVQNAYSLHVEGRGTLDFVGGTESAPNMLFLEEFTLEDFETTMLFIRNWEDKHDVLLVRHDASNIARIDADFLARIKFEGYGDAPAQWVYWSDEYWEIRPFPEPPTYGAIFGMAGLGLVIWRRRKRKQRANS